MPVSFCSFRFLLILIFIAAGSVSYAQVIPVSEHEVGDSVVTVILPAAAFASDIGFVGGGMINRYRYHPLSTPFVSMAELSALVSTKGMVDVQLRYEHTKMLGRLLRSRWTLYGQRFPLDNYFGVGNDTPFDPNAWNDDFYFYEARRFGLDWRGRKTIFRPQMLEGHLDLMTMVSLDYEVAKADGDRLMGQDRPIGFDGGWVPALGLGTIWENRDNEYNATRGNRFELTGEWAPGLILGDFKMFSVSSDFRQYVTIPIPYFFPVLATRLSGKWATGDLPYWKQPYLGDDKTLRGYPIYRFRGDAAVFYNIELRTWIFRHSYNDFKFGIHGFHDAGRVFNDGDSINDLFSDYHRTFGGGVATSVFTPDFILRIDVGFSEDMHRLYMKIGYMF